MISIFVALELLSIPAYMMAAWRKRSSVSNEAGVKYYLLGVFASTIMLFGMSYLYGTTATTKLTEIGAALTDGDLLGLEVVGVVFIVVGFAFKVSAVPFHTWAPDTYTGAPTPVTAFLSIASKAAGFVALMTLIFVAFPNNNVYEYPDLGDGGADDDRRQRAGTASDEHRAHARVLLVSQGGFILMPAGDRGRSECRWCGAQRSGRVPARLRLDEPRCVRRGHRRVPQTNSGEISSFGGLFSYAGHGGRTDGVHGVARGNPAVGRLVREVLAIGRARYARCVDHVGLCAAPSSRRSTP